MLLIESQHDRTCGYCGLTIWEGNLFTLIAGREACENCAKEVANEEQEYVGTAVIEEEIVVA